MAKIGNRYHNNIIFFNKVIINITFNLDNLGARDTFI